MPANRLEAKERGDFLALMEAAFGRREPFARYLDHDPGLGDRDTLVVRGQTGLIGAVQIFTRKIVVTGEAMLLGGIGSVATHPDHEGRGIATRLLRDAIEEMARRGMALSLLFTSRIGFYERLDYVHRPHPVWVVHGPAGVSEAQAVRLRRFDPSHLPGVRRTYEDYSRARDLVTVRDEGYWQGQLRCAGEPDEDFRVALRGGEVVAYARAIHYEVIEKVMEYGRLAGEAQALSDLLATMVPEGRPLFVPDVGDAELTDALSRRTRQLDAFSFPGRMWRILDRARLERSLGLGPETGDEALLDALLAREGAVYWLSDRF